MDSTGKVVLVTGGAVGIGAAVVERFVRDGAKVAFTYNASRAEASDLAARLGDAVLAIAADLTDEAQAAAAVARATAAFGAPEVLVANTGGLVARARIAECSLDLWRQVIDVNLTSAFLACRAVLPAMTARGSGAIVTVSSLAGRTGGAPGAVPYAAAKAAVIGFTKGLAKEMAAHGVRVNAVAPGRIATRFHERFSTPQARTAAAASTPLGREGDPSEIADAVAFLASPAASFITGETLEVNGGLLMD